MGVCKVGVDSPLTHDPLASSSTSGTLWVDDAGAENVIPLENDWDVADESHRTPEASKGETLDGHIKLNC